jgi:hypothetical protein
MKSIEAITTEIESIKREIEKLEKENKSLGSHKKIESNLGNKKEGEDSEKKIKSNNLKKGQLVRKRDKLIKEKQLIEKKTAK